MNKINRRRNSSSLMVKYPQDRFKMIFRNSPVAILLVDGSALKKILNEEIQKMNRDDISLAEKFRKKRTLGGSALNRLKILEANKAAVDLFEAVHEKELITNFISSISKSSVKVLADAMIALNQGMNFFEADIQIKTFKGNCYDCFLRISIPQDQESSGHFIVSFLDITARKEMERHLRRIAQLDGLTKLFNHYAIVERLEEELNRAKRYGMDVSCFMIDVDHFKLINDKLGHQKGDQILKRVAGLIKENIRRTDIVGRYGGDEFFVILPEIKPKNARVPARRIQQAFKQKMRKSHWKIPVVNTLSIGISGYPAKGIHEAKDLIESADKAMYQAKFKGRDRIVLL